jgi:hypothetical protein
MMRAMERKYRPEKNRRKGIWHESGNMKAESRGTGYSVVSSNLEEWMVAYSSELI